MSVAMLRSTASLTGRAAGVVKSRAMATGAAVALLSAAFVVVAVRSDGSKATNVRLDDGAVWVSNTSKQLVGRLNTRIQELDFSVRSTTSADVLQDGRAVLAAGGQGGMSAVDVLTGDVKTAKGAAPFDAYRMAGGVQVAYDPPSGRIWTGPALNTIVAPEFPKKADGVIDPGSRIVVTMATADRRTSAGDARGKVFVVGSSSFYELVLDGKLKPAIAEQAPPAGAADAVSTTTSAAPSDPKAEPVPPALVAPVPRPLTTPITDATTITAVGDRLVFLNPDGSVFSTEGKVAKVPGANAVLQQVGPAARTALVATSEGLFEVPLGGDTPVRLATANAKPSAPVRVGGCAFGAWSGAAPAYFNGCSMAGAAPSPVKGAEPDATLVFRVNGNNVALNSTGNGDMWAAHDSKLVFANNWADVANSDLDSQNDTATGSSRRVSERTCLTGGPDAPTAGADKLGARPRPSIIDVLYNDDDVNCEPIAVVPDSLQPSSGPWGRVTVIDNGQHILFSLSDAVISSVRDAAQVVEFSYIVEDPEGHRSAAAPVALTIKDTKLGNAPPELRPKGDDTTRKMRTVVEAGRSIRYDVLGDWWDPDGDDMQLVAAVSQDAGEVTSTPDGVVRYGAFGVGAGLQHVQVTMSDGLASQAEVLEITVKPTGASIPPLANNDFITLVEGASGVVKPLDNDIDPNENELSLKPGWSTTSTDFRTHLDGNALTLTGLKAGSYSLPYEAWDGSDGTKAAVFLRVIKPDGTNHAPIAVPDQVKLRLDRVVNVDVLANDVDADGDPLAVVGATATSPGNIVRASVIDRRLVQIEVVPPADGTTPTGPFFVTYVLDDGHRQERAAEQTSSDTATEAPLANGVVTVLLQPASTDQAPIAVADSATVRTGDVVSVPVLLNDVDPDGDPVTLKGVDAKEAAQLESGGQGVAWISGRYVNFRGGTPGRSTVHYDVVANGKPATGEVSFDVKAEPDPTANPNSAPSPSALVLRAIRGATVRLPVPLFGVDPDGDSVVLTDKFDGLTGAPQGNKVEVNADSPGVIDFTAGPTAGPNDQFTYAVRDRFNAVGTGTVRVVVVDNPGAPPQAHDDVYRGKPGRTLTIPVIANDTSPQDSRLELAAEPFFDLAGKVSVAPQHPDAVKVPDQADRNNQGRLSVVVPSDGTTLSEHYRISDGKNFSDAFVRVTPDDAAPNVPPVAGTDTVKAEEVQGKESAIVNVLANDVDPDDSTPLTLTVPAGQNATVDGSTVVVPLVEGQQTVLYRITDADGASTIGIIRVPGKENHPPVLSANGKNKDLRTIKAGVTAPLPIKLADIVEDPDKDPDLALTDTEITVLGGAGSVSRSDDGGFVYTPPANLSAPVTATIQFEVTDRPGKTAAERQDPLCRCLASLAVDVVVQASSPPRILSPGAVPVPQLLEPVTYDLAPLAADDQQDPLTFKLVDGAFGGLTVTQSGSTLTIESKLDGDKLLSVGTAIPLRYTVTDGNFEPVEGSVMITIIATNRGRPAAASLAEVQAKRDVNTALPNLLDKAINPFEKDGKPLTLVGPAVDNGAQVNCDATGGCQFLSTTVGTFHVTYTVKDAANQTAPGSLTVVVKGQPRAPGVPSVQSVGDHEVSLSWTAADDQGAPIKVYHVSTDDGKTMDFSTTGGKFTGLTNGTAYRFTVRAENEIGIGEASAPSSPAVPDRVPDPPISPTFTDYGDGTLMLQWAPPATANDFTAIQKYEIAIGGQTLSTDGSTTTITATGLQNGTAYTFKVRAQNKATTNNGWGDWSSLSTSETPSRFPDPPTGVVATNSGDGGTPRLTVKWNAPAFDGGRPVNQYKVCQVENATNCQTITSGLQATFNLTRNQSASFNVIAYNTDKHANASQPSAASAAVVPVGNPDAPIISNVVSGNHALTVVASTTNNSGCNAYTIEYSNNGGASWQAGAVFNGLTNGTAYTIIARTTLAASCGTAGATYRSANSNPSAQTPYGPLVQPTMNSSLSGNVITWSWNSNRGDDGRPDWTVSVINECAGQPANAGSLSRDYGYNSGPKTCTIIVSAGGQSLQASSAQQTPPPPPPPSSISVTQGGTGANRIGTTPCGGCNWVNVHLRNFAPNTQYFVSSSIGGAGDHNVTTDGAGSADIGDGYWYCGSGSFTYSAGTYTSPSLPCP